MSERLEDLVTDGQQAVAKFDLHYGCHRRSESVSPGKTLRRDSAQPRLLHIGTPSFGNSHCVRTT
jgi:hypothetical protein